jgi:hypothetical protein
MNVWAVASHLAKRGVALLHWLLRLHVSMKACKHEAAYGLLGSGGSYFDGHYVLAGPTNLQGL